jgi:hypothetical protein
LELLEKERIAEELLKANSDIIAAGFEILVFLAQHDKFDKSLLQSIATQHNITYEP